MSARLSHQLKNHFRAPAWVRFDERRFVLAITALDASTELLYIEPG